MSQARSKRQDPPPRDVRPYWVERGYRPEVAAIKPGPDEDPKGEGAYQRAFAEAAKADPPRLPNPQWYPNSASAQEYMRKRNNDFMLPRGSKRPGDEQPGIQQNVRKARDPDRSPLQSTMKQSYDTSPTTSFSSNTRLPGLPPFSMPRSSENPTSPMAVNTPTAMAEQSFAAPRLTVMEPYSGPTGPVNKLR